MQAKKERKKEGKGMGEETRENLYRQFNEN